MQRTLRLGCLMLVVLGVCSRPAEAGLWDWLEELSGPGPFHGHLFSGRFNFMATIYCSDSDSSGSRSKRLFKLSEAGGRGTCLFFDHRRFRADEDARFYRVDANITEFGPSVRLHPAVELGAGVGFIHFRSAAPSGRDVTATSVTISFPRLVFMPLQAIPRAPFQNDNNWGFFKIYIRETIIVDDFDQNDFAAKPGVTFSAKNERVTSMGFIIDVPAILRLIF